MRFSIVAPMSKSTHSLADLYDLSITRLFLTGPQAILRMVLMQSERDRQAGLDTAGYVSGYRGSPVGGLDQTFWRAKAVCERSHIKHGNHSCQHYCHQQSQRAKNQVLHERGLWCGCHVFGAKLGQRREVAQGNRT